MDDDDLFNSQLTASQIAYRVKLLKEGKVITLIRKGKPVRRRIKKVTMTREKALAYYSRKIQGYFNAISRN
jgi:hypothetical protein